MKYYAIIVAGGSGKRMGSELPKQFLELNGFPVLMHTLQKFYDSVPAEIILVLNVHQHQYWEYLCEKYQFKVPHQLVKGGNTRFNSVKNGLKAVKYKSIIAVHDAVRPFASENLIKGCFQQAEELGAVVPAIPCSDSLRKSDKNGSIAIKREDYYLVQTPQCFKSDLLKKAYKQPYRYDFTDDASVVERLNYPVSLIDGEKSNIKLTYPIDLEVAEILLRSS